MRGAGSPHLLSTSETLEIETNPDLILHSAHAPRPPMPHAVSYHEPRRCLLLEARHEVSTHDQWTAPRARLQIPRAGRRALQKAVTAGRKQLRMSPMIAAIGRAVILTVTKSFGGVSAIPKAKINENKQTCLSTRISTSLSLKETRCPRRLPARRKRTRCLLETSPVCT